jgi:hypothetical protein
MRPNCEINGLVSLKKSGLIRRKTKAWLKSAAGFFAFVEVDVLI